MNPLLLIFLSLFSEPQLASLVPISLPPLDLTPLRQITSEGLQPEPISPSERFKKSDAHYFLGKYEKDSSLAMQHFEASVRDSEAVLAVEPKNPAALLAWCAAQGEIAQRSNPFKALKMIPLIVEKFLELKTIAPDFQGHVADRALGRMYQLAPSIISIGSTKKAREHFEAALKGAPDHPGNQVYWAEFLLDQGEKEEARRFAAKVISNPILLQSSLERFDWVEHAKAVLEKTAVK